MPGERLASASIHLNLRPIKRHSRRITEFLAFRFAARAFRATAIVFRLVGRNVADNRVLRHAQNLAVKQAIAGEVECVDLDLCILTNVNKADVSVRDHGVHFEHRIGGHDDSQLLGRRHDATDGMNRQLLDYAIDRSGQDLKLGSLLRLGEIAAETGGFALRFREFGEQCTMKFRHCLGTSFGDRRNRGIRFFKSTFLNGGVLLVFCQLLEVFQVGDL